MRNELEEVKLITVIQDHFSRIIDVVSAQADVLFGDQSTKKTTTQSTQIQSDSRLESSMNNSLKSFDVLTRSLETLRKALRTNISRIPCKEITLDSSEVKQSLIELNTTFAQLLQDVCNDPSVDSSQNPLNQAEGALHEIVHSVTALNAVIQQETHVLTTSKESIVEAATLSVNLLSSVADQGNTTS